MRAVAQAVVLGAAALLAWRVLHVNAVAYGEENRPVLQVPAEGERRRAALERALAHNPANVDALVRLGAEHERAGDPDRAARAFALALEVAPIDRASLRAAAALDAREGRLSQALARLDRMLSDYPDSRARFFPLLAQWLAVPEARAGLEAMASRRSPWMGDFLAYACGRADPALVASVLVRWAATGQARRPEVGCTVEALRRAGDWTSAYLVWLNTLPRARLAHVGFVFNGSFEHASTNQGFDWLADTQSAVQAVDFPPVRGAEGERALRVSWSGKRVTTPAIRQFMAMAPGRYRLGGMARLEGLQSVRGIQWSLRCADERRALLGASQRFMGAAEWRPFAFDVSIPPGCAGQVLQLEPAGLGEGTTYVSGRALFDDLRLVRAN